jgi:polar amino acid transport system substrate-binding protein
MTRRLAGVLMASVLLLAGCGGYADTAVPEPAAPDAPSLPEEADPPKCANVTRSYAPGGSVEDLLDGPTLQDIRERGRLKAGVSADSFLLGSNNPLTGRIEGFDIDLVNAVAEAIWGTADGHVELRVITAADRIPLLQADEVDIVARNMTINCDRWDDIAFSAEYYRAGQKILVRKDLENTVTGADDLAGLRVCAPDGTTSLQNIVNEAPDAEVVTAANHTGCLVKLQNGEADAITGDDTVLAGLAAQDPYAVVPEQEPFTAEPYGIGVNADNEDLARFVNAVLERMRAEGTWQDSYDRWLAPTLGEGAGQPRPVYGREDS